MTPDELATRLLRARAKEMLGDYEISLDLLEEDRLQAIEKLTQYEKGVAASYNKKVKL